MFVTTIWGEELENMKYSKMCFNPLVSPIYRSLTLFEAFLKLRWLSQLEFSMHICNNYFYTLENCKLYSMALVKNIISTNVNRFSLKTFFQSKIFNTLFYVCHFFVLEINDVWRTYLRFSLPKGYFAGAGGGDGSGGGGWRGVREGDCCFLIGFIARKNDNTQ